MARDLLGAGIEDYTHVYPPPGFIPFMRAGSVVVPPNTLIGAPLIPSTSIINFALHRQGWISLLGIFIASTLNGTWSLLKNGAAERDYVNINTSFGAPTTPVRVYVPVVGTQDISLAFTNSSPAANMAAQWLIYGWFNPR